MKLHFSLWDYHWLVHLDNKSCIGLLCNSTFRCANKSNLIFWSDLKLISKSKLRQDILDFRPVSIPLTRPHEFNLMLFVLWHEWDWDGKLVCSLFNCKRFHHLDINARSLTWEQIAESQGDWLFFWITLSIHSSVARRYGIVILFFGFFLFFNSCFDDSVTDLCNDFAD